MTSEQHRAETADRQIISGQLRLGDSCASELGKVMDKLDVARELAGLNRLLFLPSQNKAANDAVLEHCRRRGVEVYLWYKILADNPIIPEEDELSEDAWGNKEPGESGIWRPIFESEDANFRFCCPRNRKYTGLLLNRCRQAMRDYDGLFADCIGFPLPTLGLESVYTCFCPTCLADEPRLAEWRRNIQEMRESLVSATDGDLARWGTLRDMVAQYNLDDFFRFRYDTVTELAEKFAKVAREAGKGFGVDVISPVLSYTSGHDYQSLGRIADWLKPRIYFRTYGPSSISLELFSLTMGLKSWGSRFSIPAILEIIERSTGIKTPRNVHALDQNFLDDSLAINEIQKAVAMAAPCAVHPGLDFSLHPDYDTGITIEMVRTFLDAARDLPGIVLTWNIMYIPDDFLVEIGRAR